VPKVTLVVAGILVLSLAQALGRPATAGSVGSLSGRIASKSGPSNARTWVVSVTNNAATPANAALITAVSLTQTSGAACAPLVTAALPVALGTISASGSVSGNVVFDFSGCAANVRFTVDIDFSANAGAATGGLLRFNGHL
jgi:hypothetical protein